MNKIILTGRLTKDPELRFTPGNGNAVSSFSIAVDDGFGDNKKTYFFNIVVWGKTAEAVANFTHKGSKVLVNGKLTNSTYEAQDGIKKYITEVVADSFNGIEFLDSKNSQQDNSNNNVSSNNYSGNTDMYADGENEPDIMPVDDGDMPF